MFSSPYWKPGKRSKYKQELTDITREVALEQDYPCWQLLLSLGRHGIPANTAALDYEKLHQTALGYFWLIVAFASTHPVYTSVGKAAIVPPRPLFFYSIDKKSNRTRRVKKQHPRVEPNPGGEKGSMFISYVHFLGQILLLLIRRAALLHIQGVSNRNGAQNSWKKWRAINGK